MKLAVLALLVKIAVVFGLGGVFFDPPAGQRYLVQRLHKIGVSTCNSPYQYYDTEGIAACLRGKADWRGVIGASFGASYMPNYAASVPTLDYAGGFQASVWSFNGPVMYLPPSVKFAHLIRDPYWFDTGGLGFGQWVATSKRMTVVTTNHRGAHPDDWGWSQNLIFNEVKRKIGVAK